MSRKIRCGLRGPPRFGLPFVRSVQPVRYDTDTRRWRGGLRGTRSPYRISLLQRPCAGNL